MLCHTAATGGQYPLSMIVRTLSTSDRWRRWRCGSRRRGRLLGLLQRQRNSGAAVTMPDRTVGGPPAERSDGLTALGMMDAPALLRDADSAKAIDDDHTGYGRRGRRPGRSAAPRRGGAARERGAPPLAGAARLGHDHRARRRG